LDRAARLGREVTLSLDRWVGLKTNGSGTGPIFGTLRISPIGSHLPGLPPKPGGGFFYGKMKKAAVARDRLSAENERAQLRSIFCLYNNEECSTSNSYLFVDT
jgi:hypothetical protein